MILNTLHSIMASEAKNNNRLRFCTNPPLSKNLTKTAKKYKMTKGGYFGEKSKTAKKERTRTIFCKNSPYKEAKKFFKSLTQGYIAKPLPTKYGMGKIVIFDDDTTITFRPVTSSPILSIQFLSEKKSQTFRLQRIRILMIIQTELRQNLLPMWLLFFFLKRRKLSLNGLSGFQKTLKSQLCL